MDSEIGRLIKEVLGGARVISVSGLTSTSAKAYVLSRLSVETGKRLVIVADTNSELEVWAADLSYFIPDGTQVLSLPSFTTDPYSGASPHAETEEERALALWRMANGEGDIVVTSERALENRKG